MLLNAVWYHQPVVSEAFIRVKSPIQRKSDLPQFLLIYFIDLFLGWEKSLSSVKLLEHM